MSRASSCSRLRTPKAPHFRPLAAGISLAIELAKESQWFLNHPDVVPQADGDPHDEVGKLAMHSS